VNGALTLNMARAHLARFVTFPSAAALDLATLWAAHTHVRSTTDRLMFDSSPRFVLTADGPAAGKTAAMERILSLSFNGNTVVDPTPLSFATLVDEARPTVGIDEIDNLFGAGAAKQQLRSLLNAGYKPGTHFSRGKASRIDVFAPVVMAGIGERFRVAAELAPLRSRSIIIEMRPAPCPEPYRRRDHGPMTDAIRDQLTVWARRNARAILDSRPDIPDGIDNRLREVAEPLFMVAHAAGGHWPQSAADAARELLLGEMSAPPAGELDLFGQLLADLRTVYADAPKLATADVVAGLYDLPAGRYGKLWPNPNKAPRELAAMLAPLGVEPTPLDIGGQTRRGYHRWALEPLWQDEITSITASDDVIELDDDDELVDVEA